jgi:hypothetical protein
MCDHPEQTRSVAVTGIDFENRAGRDCGHDRALSGRQRIRLAGLFHREIDTVKSVERMRTIS